MKTLSFVVGLLASGLFEIQAAPISVDPNQNQVPAPTDYAVIKQDGDSRVWERTVYEKSASGQIIPHTHRYTELATGLNYKDANGNWQAAKEEIDILPDGRAAATNGQHQAYFPSDIYNGEIELVTPAGETLKSQPVGLCYDDGNKTVFIALLTNSVGQLVSANQIVYPNAFTGLNADLRYTYRKSGFEQDVILHEQPPATATLGLNPETTKIQILTEFFNPPAPRVTTAAMATSTGTIPDQQLTFGGMQMGQGNAFVLGSSSPFKNGKFSEVLSKLHW
jgi:hypothetical protein